MAGKKAGERSRGNRRYRVVLKALVPLNGWNQIPVSPVSPAPLPGLLPRHSVSPLPCVTFANHPSILSSKAYMTAIVYFMLFL